jgi:hypothetical protein
MDPNGARADFHQQGEPYENTATPKRRSIRTGAGSYRPPSNRYPIPRNVFK